MIFLFSFFQQKVLKCSYNYRCAFIHIDAFMNAHRNNALFEFNCNSSAEKVTQIALYKYECGNGPKSCERFLVSKMDFFLRFSSGIKYLPIDPVFSSWVKVIKKLF